MGPELKSRIVLTTARVAAAFARSETGDEEVFYLAAALLDSVLAGDVRATALGTQAIGELMDEFDEARSQLATLRMVVWLLERRVEGGAFGPTQAVVGRPRAAALGMSIDQSPPSDSNR